MSILRWVAVCVLDLDGMERMMLLGQKCAQHPRVAETASSSTIFWHVCSKLADVMWPVSFGRFTRTSLKHGFGIWTWKVLTYEFIIKTCPQMDAM